jgi:copper chaperone CopZ
MTTSIELSTPTASCGACRARIAAAFDGVHGVESAVLDLETRRTTVAYDPDTIDEATIVETLVDAGYPPAS